MADTNSVVNSADAGGANPDPISVSTSEPSAQPVKQEPAAVPSNPAEQPPVEVDTQPPSAEPTARPKASDFYHLREAKKQIKDLTDRVEMLTRRLDAPKPAVPQPQVDPAIEAQKLEQEFAANPGNFLLNFKNILSRGIQEEAAKIQQALIVPQAQKEYERQSYEAFNTVLFPAEKGSPNEPLKDRVARNAELDQTYKQIAIDYGLQQVIKTDPMKAAKAIRAIYEQSRNAAVPKAGVSKAQVTPTSTGLQPSGGKPMTEQELSARMTALDARLDANPKAFLEDDYIKEKELLNAEYMKLTSKK